MVQAVDRPAGGARTPTGLHLSGGSLIDRAIRVALRLPPFYKILAANSALILAWGGAGLWILHHSFSAAPWGTPAMLLFGGAVVGSILLNSLLIHLALAPLRDLSDIMRAVARGETRLRARTHSLGGGMFDQCVESFNAMLDRLEATMAALEEERERSRQQAIQVIQAQEEERKRVARELHDETSQVLASLIIGLEQLHRNMPDSLPNCLACRSDVHRMKQNTDRILEELHRLAFNLRPSLLDDMGLRHALSWLIREQVEKKGIAVHFTLEGPDRRLPDEIEIALFRVAQEAITNILKYADASTVTVVLRHEADRVALEITDDGKGFDPERTRREGAKHLGLFGMRERVSLISGTFHLRSIPGEGTTISASIPVPAAARPAPDAKGAS